MNGKASRHEQGLAAVRISYGVSAGSVTKTQRIGSLSSRCGHPRYSGTPSDRFQPSDKARFQEASCRTSEKPRGPAEFEQKRRTQYPFD